MKNTLKKLTAIMLSLLMVFGCIPKFVSESKAADAAVTLTIPTLQSGQTVDDFKNLIQASGCNAAVSEVTFETMRNKFGYTIAKVRLSGDFSGIEKASINGTEINSSDFVDSQPFWPYDETNEQKAIDGFIVTKFINQDDKLDITRAYYTPLTLNVVCSSSFDPGTSFDDVACTFNGTPGYLTINKDYGSYKTEMKTGDTFEQDCNYNVQFRLAENFPYLYTKILYNGVELSKTDSTVYDYTPVFTRDQWGIHVNFRVTSDNSPKYDVSFDLNGGTGSMNTVTTKSPYSLPTCTLTPPTDKSFMGWSLTKNGDKIRTSSITLTENITLYPIWGVEGEVYINYKEPTKDELKLFDTDSAELTVDNIDLMGTEFTAEVYQNYKLLEKANGDIAKELSLKGKSFVVFKGDFGENLASFTGLDYKINGRHSDYWVDTNDLFDFDSLTYEDLQKIFFYQSKYAVGPGGRTIIMYDTYDFSLDGEINIGPLTPGTKAGDIVATSGNVYKKSNHEYATPVIVTSELQTVDDDALLEAGKEYILAYIVNSPDNDGNFKSMKINGVTIPYTKAELDLNPQTGWNDAHGIMMMYKFTCGQEPGGGSGGSRKKKKTETKPVEPTELTPEEKVIEELKKEDVKKADSKEKEKINPSAKFINGYDDGTFKPERNVNNIELMSMVTELYSNVDVSNALNLNQGENYWGEEIIKKANTLGLVPGNKEDKDYNVAGEVTRGDLAIVVYNLIKDKSNSPSLSTRENCKDAIGKNYETAVTKLVDLGILKGFDDGLFHGERTLTRAEAVVVINRALRSLGFEIKLDKIELSFPDLTPEHWAYSEIMYASNK